MIILDARPYQVEPSRSWIGIACKRHPFCLHLVSIVVAFESTKTCKGIDRTDARMCGRLDRFNAMSSSTMWHRVQFRQ